MAALHTSRDDILPPPVERSTIIGWVLKNLFNSWYNALLTLVTGYIVYLVLRGSLTWAFTDARWEVIPNNMRNFLVGQYPSAIAGETDYIWRIWLCLHLLAALIGLTWGVRVRRSDPIALFLLALPIGLGLLPVVYFFIWRPENLTAAAVFSAGLQFAALDAVGLLGLAIGRFGRDRFSRLVTVLWILYFPLVILLVRGVGEDHLLREAPLASIQTRFWGGLLLSLILSVVGIVGSFPIGVVLALGRQSKLPILKYLSIAYIEFIRGVPLISLLYMGSVMLNLFLPEGITFDRVVRAMVPITMFSAAYLAENIRGGLQAIPRGQYEAAWALGLNGFQTMSRIIMPQALRTVIPVMVGQFIGLFKDTSLVAIVGLLDLLGIARGVIANPDYIGTQREVFLFISLFYFVFSYALSYTSQRLETSLGVGVR